MEQTILITLSTIVTGGVSYWMGKKKSDAETDNQVIKNLELAVGLYIDIIQSLKDEIHQLNNKVTELEGKIDTLMKENIKLKTKIKSND